MRGLFAPKTYRSCPSEHRMTGSNLVRESGVPGRVPPKVETENAIKKSLYVVGASFYIGAPKGYLTFGGRTFRRWMVS